MVETAHSLVKKRHVGQVTNRGEASRKQKKQCWSGDGQETENRFFFFEYVGQVTVKSGDRQVIVARVFAIA